MRREKRGLLIDRSAAHTKFQSENLRVLRKLLRRQQNNIKLELECDYVDWILKAHYRDQ
jgi:hypothetical protein